MVFTRFIPRFQIRCSLDVQWSPVHSLRILRSPSTRNPRFPDRPPTTRKTWVLLSFFLQGLLPGFLPGFFPGYNHRSLAEAVAGVSGTAAWGRRGLLVGLGVTKSSAPTAHSISRPSPPVLHQQLSPVDPRSTQQVIASPPYMATLPVGDVSAHHQRKTHHISLLVGCGRWDKG